MIILAQVYRTYGREFICKRLDTHEKVNAKALAKLGRGEDLVVGDQVKLVPEKGNKESYCIVELLPRKNEVYRLLPRERKKKVSASNVDYLVIMSSVSKPLYKRGFVDRYLIRSEQWNIPALIVFNKMDEYDGKSFDLVFELERFAYRNIPCFQISSKGLPFTTGFGSHKPLGEQDFEQTLRNKSALFMGQSGVGKSTFISRLSGGSVDLRRGEVGKKGKGKHTTTWSEMVESGNFTLIDSPGIRSFSLDDIKDRELMGFFPSS